MRKTFLASMVMVMATLTVAGAGFADRPRVREG